jgi:hypothetical protein
MPVTRMLLLAVRVAEGASESSEHKQDLDVEIIGSNPMIERPADAHPRRFHGWMRLHVLFAARLGHLIGRRSLPCPVEHSGVHPSIDHRAEAVFPSFPR